MQRSRTREWTAEALDSHAADDLDRLPYPVKSSNGELIEKMNGFFVVAFQKGLGASWSDEISQNEEFNKLGEIAGRMHALAKKYVPSTAEITRYDGKKIVIFKNS